MFQSASFDGSETKRSTAAPARVITALMSGLRPARRSGDWGEERRQSLLYSDSGSEKETFWAFYPLSSTDFTAGDMSFI